MEVKWRVNGVHMEYMRVNDVLLRRNITAMCYTTTLHYLDN